MDDDEEIFNYVKNFSGDIESWNSEENQKEFENLLDKVCNKYHKVSVPTTTSHIETQTEVVQTHIDTQTEVVPTTTSHTQTELNFSTIIKVGYNKALNFKN
jgi:hypothetical protein